MFLFNFFLIFSLKFNVFSILNFFTIDFFKYIYYMNYSFSFAGNWIYQLVIKDNTSFEHCHKMMTFP